jgi:hypothetical protein
MSELYRDIHGTFASPGETIQMVAWLGVPEGRRRTGFRIPAEGLIAP